MARNESGQHQLKHGEDPHVDDERRRGDGKLSSTTAAMSSPMAAEPRNTIRLTNSRLVRKP